MEEKKKWRIVVAAIIVLAVIAVLQSRSIVKLQKDLKIERSKKPAAERVLPATNTKQKFQKLGHVFDPWNSGSDYQRLDERNTFDRFDEMQRQMAYIFGEMLRSVANPQMMNLASGMGFAPSASFEEARDHWIIRFDVPGLEKDKIAIKVSNGILTIDGERKSEKVTGDESDGFYATEIQYGSFSRSVALPPTADEGKVDASYTNGVLTVKIGKRAGSEKAVQQVKIQ